MSIFFFHLKHGDDLAMDEEGTNLPDLASARHEALQSAREILAGAIKGGHSDVPDSIIVMDEHGRTVDSIRLAAVLPPTLRALIREQ
jgi:hypothetical protein